MEFERQIFIQRRPETVFNFLLYKDRFPQEAGSPVLALEKLTTGLAGVGTRYREVVQIFPFIKGTIFSTIQRCEAPCHLEEIFAGSGMRGYLAYEFIPEAEGTRLVQRESIYFQGLMRPFSPLLEKMLLRRIEERLAGIKTVLESGWMVEP